MEIYIKYNSQVGTYINTKALNFDQGFHARNNYFVDFIITSSVRPYDDGCLSSKTLPSSLSIFLFSSNIAFNNEVATVILISFFPFFRYFDISAIPET